MTLDLAILMAADTRPDPDPVLANPKFGLPVIAVAATEDLNRAV